jgi:hypothetical protein
MAGNSFCIDHPPGLGGVVDSRRPLQLRQLQIDLAVEQIAAILVDQISLVERQHQGTASVDRHRQHPLILFGQRLRGVDEPCLSRRMGHGTFESMYYYVHTSPDFMAAYADITRQRQSLLAQVGF